MELRRADQTQWIVESMTFSTQPSSLLIHEYRADKGTVGVRENKRQVLAYFPQQAAIWHSSNSSPTQRIEIPKGAVVAALRDRRETVEWITDSTVLSVEMDDQMLSDTAKTLLGRPSAEIVASPGIVDARLSGLFEPLRIEYQLGFPTGQLFISSIEQALASYLVMNRGTSLSEPVFFQGGISPSTSRRILEFIRTNIATDLSISELAKVADMSPSHFARSFRGAFRTTPHDFIVQMRMELAKDLLRGNDFTLLDIAQLTGFKTQQHFSRVFARAIGVSPGRFRHLL
jgi:AraC family transcriptional regulator